MVAFTVQCKQCLAITQDGNECAAEGSPVGGLPCKWSQDTEEGDLWHTGCGRLFRLDAGTPTENAMCYCYHCGKVVHEDRVSGWADRRASAREGR